MTSKIIDKKDIPYLLFIFFIWLFTYIVCQIAFEQKLGWDEISYLTTARGIAEHFDFSGRSHSIMGLIKYPFPQNTHHYPVYSTYLAIFFKLFGVSLQVAYFSTWFACLIACIFIYFTLVLLTGGNRKLAFFFGLSFLFLPKITDYCDSAMMEVPGAALLSVIVFVISRDILKGRVNPFLLAVFALLLFFYKSLFIGILFSFTVLILSMHSMKFTRSNILDLSLFLGTFAFLNVIFTKFIFLPMSPMFNFDPKTEAPEGTYADFLGGFLNDTAFNLTDNYRAFYDTVIKSYYPINTIFTPQSDAVFFMIPAWIELAIYYLAVFYVIVFAIMLWKKLAQGQRIFILFSMTSILSFNFIYISIVGGGVGLISRYNLIYVPLIMISLGCLLSANYEYFKPFLSEHKKGLYFVAVSFILIVYVTFHYSVDLIVKWNKDVYHNIAHKNSEVVKKFIGNSNPMFVYFTVGTHTTWDMFPTRVVLMEATNDQIKKLNLKLPKPIEYLFLNPKNNLFRINQDLILKGQPIIDNWYTLHDIDSGNKIVVYKFNPNHPNHNEQQ